MTTKARATRKTGRPAAAGVAGALAGALAFAGLWIWLEPNAGRDPAAQIGGPFTLVADDGRIVTEQSFPGKYLIVYFGYTACRDVCPATLNTLAAAMGRLGDQAARVQPLFITLDPGHDNPAVLHRYVKAFTPTLIGLTGTPAALHRAADAYRVASVLHQEGPGGYALDHSSVLFLMGPDGRLVAPVPAGADVAVMARDIARGI